jgi:hypothetical protein
VRELELEAHPAGLGRSSLLLIAQNSTRAQGAAASVSGQLLETNAFRTDAAVHRFVPWIVGTFSAFSCSAICSRDIRFASIASIFIRHV